MKVFIVLALINMRIPASLGFEKASAPPTIPTIAKGITAKPRPVTVVALSTPKLLLHHQRITQIHSYQAKQPTQNTNYHCSNFHDYLTFMLGFF
jgi:hypothetical protein